MKRKIIAIALLSASALAASHAIAGTPAARMGDNHVCGQVTGIVPHVGGPIVQGAPNVLICGKPAARLGDPAACAGPQDTIAVGSGTVLIGGRPAAYQGGRTAHGGSIMQGCPTVLIGH